MLPSKTIGPYHDLDALGLNGRGGWIVVGTQANRYSTTAAEMV